MTFSGLQIDPPSSSPELISMMESPASGDLNAGKTVSLTLKLSEAVTVAGGTPTLTLNDGGTATYTGGSGTNALTFSYAVATGQNTSSLAVTAVNLNAATVKDGAGNRRQSRAQRPDPKRPADRHHHADCVVSGDVGDRHHERIRRSQCRRDCQPYAQIE